MSTKAQRKGNRNENEARRILTRVWRKPEKVDGYGNTDPWNIADIIALDPQLGTLIAQVKTNGVSSREKDHIRSRARMYVPDNIRIEIWNRVDRQGWQVSVLDWDTGAFRKIVQMDTCDTEATVERYREAVPFYPKETQGVRQEMRERWSSHRDQDGDRDE